MQRATPTDRRSGQRHLRARTAVRGRGAPAACLVALLLGSACGGDRPSESGSGAPLAIDPLRRAPQALVERERPLAPAVDLLGELDLGRWRLASELGADTPLEGEARLEADGLVLEGPRIAAFRLVPLPPDCERIEVDGLLASSGRDGSDDDGYARLGVLELSTEALSADLADSLGAIVGQHFGEPLTEDLGDPLATQLGFAPQPATRSLLVVCESIDPEGGKARSRFDRLRVRSVDRTRAASSLADELLIPAGGDVGLPYGRYAADLVHRHGVALPPATTVVVPVEGDWSGGRFSAWVCVLGRDHEATWEFVAAWTDGTDGRDELARLTLEVAPDGDADTAPSGWVELTGELPATARDGALVLGVSLTPGAGDVPGDAVGVFAGARLTRAGERAPKPNVLLISLDTLRADHVGAYGSNLGATPVLDGFAESALLFEDMWTTAPYTLPSHMSLFSGQHPSVHGVERPIQRRDRLRSALVTELLADAGYRTAAFTGGAMVLPRFGFADGFERYGVLDPCINRESERIAKLLAGVPGVGPRAYAATGPEAIAEQLARFDGEPWFLFVHTYAAHEFDPPREHMQALGFEDGLPADDPDILRYLSNQQPPPPALRRRLEELYAGGVRQADALVGDLLRLLEERGELDSTVVIVTSDHGKEIGEHGMVGHGHVLYEELTRVPLIVRAPGLEPGRRTDPAQLIDVLPTLAGLLGLPRPERVQGSDLLADAERSSERALWAEVDALWRRQALRRGSRKTIHDLESDRFESFDLDDDPGELAPMDSTDEEREALRALARSLLDLHAASPSAGGAATPLDAAARAHLEALGYLTQDEADSSSDD